MTKLGIRIGKTNVKIATIPDLSSTSEANQWKVHQSGIINHTGSSPVVKQHGLTYTPFFLSFTKTSGNNYYQWGNINCYADPSNISLSPNSGAGDITGFVVMKDFGA